MCQLFQMVDRRADWQRKKGSLFRCDEHLGSMLFELCDGKVNLGSTIFFYKSVFVVN